MHDCYVCVIAKASTKIHFDIIIFACVRLALLCLPALRAARGATVILGCRNKEAAQKVVEQIK